MMLQDSLSRHPDAQQTRDLRTLRPVLARPEAQAYLTHRFGGDMSITEAVSGSDISVVIATYNGSGFIGEAIHSVVRQTAQVREIIVIDDCSTDDTVAVVRQSATRVPLHVRSLPRNLGRAEARNIGCR